MNRQEFKKITLSKAKRMSLLVLESAIYNCYYHFNPNGDARFGLWPQVIQAKKSKNPKNALIRILKTQGGIE